MRIWHYFFDNCVDIEKRTEIKKVLGTHELNSNKLSGPGIIFFCKFDKRLYDLLRDISHNGIERILLIAIDSSVLDSRCIWHLLHAGASDVVVMNGSLKLPEIMAKFERWNEVDRIIESSLVRNNIVGQSSIWKSTLRNIVEIASFTNASVLITGESGTGKELVARLIHTLDSRENKGKLVILDCTTIVPELSGSEFFGHEKGAFTSAINSRDGAFALADKGTLFLDEVGELPLSLQAQLLRVIQERTYKRVGGNTWQNTDFRLICATNRNLPNEVEEGRFRRDLYYRIAGWNCELPPLRSRPEDIIPLVQHFISKYWQNGDPPDLDESVKDYLIKRNYPGNVRDLEQLISRISYFHVGTTPITVGDIPKEERPSMELSEIEWRNKHFEDSIRCALSLGIRLKEIGRSAEDVAIRIALDEAGNLKRAAGKLGITERALQMRRAARLQKDQLPNAILSNSENDQMLFMDQMQSETIYPEDEASKDNGKVLHIARG